MFSLRALFFIALAIACVFAAEEAERVKKQVYLGGAAYPYAAGYAGAIPTAYSAGVIPTAYSAGYGAYPYSAGLYGSGLYY